MTGQLEAFSNGAGTAESHTVIPFGLKNADGGSFDESEQQTPHIKGISRESRSTLDFFKC